VLSNELSLGRGSAVLMLLIIQK